MNPEAQPQEGLGDDSEVAPINTGAAPEVPSLEEDSVLPTEGLGEDPEEQIAQEGTLH